MADLIQTFLRQHGLIAFRLGKGRWQIKGRTLTNKQVQALILSLATIKPVVNLDPELTFARECQALGVDILNQTTLLTAFDYSRAYQNLEVEIEKTKVFLKESDK